MDQYVEKFGPIDQHEAMKIGAKVCQALDYVWNNFLTVHRDIKPQNILIDQDGNVKICDFGMVTDHGMNSVDTNAIEGTPYYLSPEAISEGEYLDNRSDLYSLGATLYHVICGEPPFDYDDFLKVVMARLNEDPPDIRAIKPEITKGVASILLTMMAKSPLDRYVTAYECALDFERLSNNEEPWLADQGRNEKSH